MSAAITGIVSPVLTPIDEDGSVALDRVETSVRFAVECGSHAVVAAGTGVQETTALTVDERKALIEETTAAAHAEDVPVLAGVSHPASHVVSDLIDHAEATGVDALLAMPPWGIAPDTDDAVAYYEHIDERAGLPVLMYNNPTVTVDMDRETMRQIAELDSIAYVKETSRNYRKLAWLVERIDRAGLADVFGTMDVLLPVLQAGGAGAVIPAPANAPAMRLYEQFQDGDLTAAMETQRSFTDFPPDAAETGLTAVAKAGAELSGVRVGDPRPPYQPVADEVRNAISDWLHREDIPTME